MNQTRSTAPRLLDTAAIPTFGHLSWVVWFWAGGAVLFVLAMVVMSITDDADSITIFGGDSNSLWSGLISIQAWIVFGAGVTSIPSYGSTFLANGSTRAQLSRSTVVALVVVCALGGLYALVGYGVEHVVYDAKGWEHALPDGRAVDGIGPLVSVGVTYAATLACYFVAGWLVGIAYLRLGWVLFVLSLIPAALPIAAADVFLDGASTTDLTQHWSRPPLALGLLAVAAVVALSCTVATRFTREVVFEP